MKKLTKAGLKKQIETIKKENLKQISQLAMTNWKAYKYIADITSYQVKYYSKMTIEEIFYMMIELKKCLKIDLSLEDEYYIKDFESKKIA
jgi:hypothetical protein